MTENLEWGGAQQLLLLLRSILLGVVCGVLLDLFTGFGRGANRRSVFALDLCYGMIAAWFTFFFCLVYNNGKLHPILFLGCGTGMLLEHYSVGRRLSRVAALSLRCVRRFRKKIRSGLRQGMHHLYVHLVKICSIIRKRSKKAEKNQKKACFFKKKT